LSVAIAAPFRGPIFSILKSFSVRVIKVFMDAIKTPKEVVIRVVLFILAISIEAVFLSLRNSSEVYLL
jgi:hypothetical protein